MTKDYAPPSTTRKKSTGKSNKSKPAPGKGKAKKSGAHQAPPPPPPKAKGKLFFGLAILLGAFGYGLYFLQSVPPAAPLDEEPQKITKKKSVTKPETKSQDEDTQRFKFYDLLPESEVVPPKVSAYQFKEKNKSETYYYIVQTGSFKNRADAERQKATIAFQGLKGSIKSVQSSSGTTWHRVSTGPFYTRTDMNSALDKLVAIDIEPLVKKIKKDQ